MKNWEQEGMVWRSRAGATRRIAPDDLANACLIAARVCEERARLEAMFPFLGGWDNAPETAMQASLLDRILAADQGQASHAKGTQ